MPRSPFYDRYKGMLKPVTGNKQTQGFAGLFFSIALSGLIIFFVMQPMFKEMGEIEAEVNEKKGILSTLVEKRRNIEEGKRNLEALDGETKALVQDAIPQKTQIVDLVNNINGSLAAGGISLRSMQIQPMQIIASDSAALKHPEKEELPFTISAPADYQKAILALEAMTKTSRLFRIDLVTMTKQEDADMALTLMGKAYIIK